jgi:hypothetical protein
MTEERTTKKIETLELNRETLQDLTEWEGEQVVGGLRPLTNDPKACARARGLSEDPRGCARAGLTNDPQACA